MVLDSRSPMGASMGVVGWRAGQRGAGKQPGQGGGQPAAASRYPQAVTRQQPQPYGQSQPDAAQRPGNRYPQAVSRQPQAPPSVQPGAGNERSSHDRVYSSRRLE